MELHLEKTTISISKRKKYKVELDLHGECPAASHKVFAKVIARMMDDEEDYYSHLEYAERMVAAWNAFEGIKTKDISSKLVTKD